MSSDARKSVENGIWLCQNCAKVIDDSKDAFPVETLMAWKRHAESVAAKEARSTLDEIGDVINQIEEVYRVTVNLVLWSRQNDPLRYGRFNWGQMTEEERNEAFKNESKLSNDHHSQMQAMYRAHISPDLATVLARSTRILGPENIALREALSTSQYAETNELGIAAMGEALLKLRAELQLS